MLNAKNHKEARRLEIKGIVQGVGFRPFVYQLAHRFKIAGEVSNTSDGVVIYAEGVGRKIDAFQDAVTAKGPPLAHITEAKSFPESVRGMQGFSISKSKTLSVRATLIAPDVSICDDCRRELFDPADRRYGYPFINCTNCGPRYSIISDIPYDRPNTSMKPFQMCTQCQHEYDDPLDRRFHAQPNACEACGPSVTLYDREKNRIETPDAIKAAAECLKDGRIVAVKGIGGFHLAVDAENSDAVESLRKRKHREEKPFALMAADDAKILTFAHIEPDEFQLLTSSQRPIVLLRKKEPNPIADTVSPRNRYFGTMLPYTPLHYLLLQFDFTALVMTSGNISEEPIAIDNEEAFARLSDIADFFLMNDRDIYIRSDDSIVKFSANACRILRRSRGYVPVPVQLKNTLPHVLACGAELKNTFCLTKGREAFLSQHIGDLENQQAFDFFQKTIAHMKRILDIEPEIVAYDLHPDYLSIRYAEGFKGVKSVGVQHHHAHIVSCMAENHVGGPVIGLSFDGTGYGSDGHVWGGEVLLAEESSFNRLAHLAYVPMPGGAAAIREPWRMAVSYLYHTFEKDFKNLRLPVIETVEAGKLNFVTKMIDKQVNSPLTSSLGRLFDGIAAIVGIRNRVFYEGQAAMELEMLADEIAPQAYSYHWGKKKNCQVDIKPVIRGVVDDMHQQISPAVISARFHATLVQMFTDLCVEIEKEHGLNRVALSGGVFQNSILLNGLCQMLEEKGFTVFTHKQVPTNDGGISLGQAVAAYAMTNR
ncbi:carbamoyltransferase HypF [Thermodesulfobacteriota bacterium]